jgi:hypothetical protein
MATDLALPHAERKAAVLGSGVVGLTSARELQRHGFDVTIYAATVPPDTTSNMSLAGFTPPSGFVDNDKRTPEFDAQFRQAVLIAYRRLNLLAGPKYGITWISNYQPTDIEPVPGGGGGGGGNNAPGGPGPLMPRDIPNPRVVLYPGEHPFPTKYAIERPEMRIEPMDAPFIRSIRSDSLAASGTACSTTSSRRLSDTCKSPNWNGLPYAPSKMPSPVDQIWVFTHGGGLISEFCHRRMPLNAWLWLTLSSNT